MSSRRLGAALLAAASLVLAAPAAAETLVAPLLGGGAFDLAARRGRVVLVNYWATWCEPCRAEIPALNAFYRRRHGQGLDIVGLSADVGRDRAAVEKMARSIAYPVGMLREASSNSFGAARALPITFVVDRSGSIRATLRPDETPVTENTLESVVGPLLKEQ